MTGLSLGKARRRSWAVSFLFLGGWTWATLRLGCYHCLMLHRKGGVDAGTSFRKPELSHDEWWALRDEWFWRGWVGAVMGVKGRRDKVNFPMLSVSCQFLPLQALCALRLPLSLPSQECWATASLLLVRTLPSTLIRKTQPGCITSAQGGAWRTKQPLTALSGNDSTPFRNGSRGKIHSSNLIIFAPCLQRVWNVSEVESQGCYNLFL